VPWLDDNYPTRAESFARAIIGAGLGGLSAAHIARRRPTVFGWVGAQSGFFGDYNDALLRDYAAAPNLGIRFHLMVGEFETDMRGEGKPSGDLVAAQRRLAQVLRDKGYIVQSVEYPEGHQWGFWRAHLGEMLRYFWGK
jgi:enterochelin esterase-like enzyme